MQPIDEIEKHYATPDPWGYQTNPDDIFRKKRILDVLNMWKPLPFMNALDVGAGEGWITKDLPARVKHAYEISKNAKSRLPEGVRPITHVFDVYDLIVATGVLYSHYNYREFFEIMRKNSLNLILTCNIKEWERPEMNDLSFHENYLRAHQIYTDEFPYREYTQKLRVLRKW
jgi:hypothetical protein